MSKIIRHPGRYLQIVQWIMAWSVLSDDQFSEMVMLQQEHYENNIFFGFYKSRKRKLHCHDTISKAQQTKRRGGKPARVSMTITIRSVRWTFTFKEKRGA
jgi:hypothetical protein